MTDPEPSTPNNDRPSRWPWILLGLGLVWTVLIRVPLVLNAADHLDSDLAVDGLTLLDATKGHWRWHYPGTPHMGILPVAMSWIQAMLWGATPATLVSGGTLMWILACVAIFGLAWRVFGRETAAWSLVPLVFSSIGTIWLSGRITGGHLITLLWHAAAFLGFAVCLNRPAIRNVTLLGLWCGLGLYLDTMFLFTLVGLVSAAGVFWFVGGRSRPAIAPLAAFVVAFAVGFLPGVLGRILDPYDAYPDQFQPLWDVQVLASHASILGWECVPRLIAGVELSGLQKDLAPWGRTFADQIGGILTHPQRGRAMVLADLAAFVLAMALLVPAVLWLIVDPGSFRDRTRLAVRFGLLVSSAAILAAFVVNRNIFNSDNYRYLVLLVVPWAIGFGLFTRWLAGRSNRGRVVAVMIAAAFALTMTLTTESWYRSKRHYLDGFLYPVIREARLEVGVKEPGLGRGLPVSIPEDATHLLGDYWDVYRLSFLMGGRVTGVPYPIYPNRFPGWSNGLGPGRGKLLIPNPLPGWRDALFTLWERERRDRHELDQLDYIVPL